jgi:hypothetical protein
MKRLALLALFLAPLAAYAQPEKAAEVRLAPSVGGAGAASAAPVPLTLTVPNLAAAPSAAALPAAALSAAPALAAAPASTVRETSMSPMPVPAMRAAPASAAETRAPGARGELERGGRVFAAPNADGGREFFDGGSARANASPVLGAASDGPRLSRPEGRADKPATAIPLRQRLGETADLGVVALGFQLLTGIAFLALGAHAGFPALAGAFWVLAGTELIKQLGKLRSTVVGGWQASHDQKMRTDYGTGKLIDIRGRKYGEDRYDIFAPGPVSARERWTLDATAFALGLPWVLPAGPKAVALYAAGAAAALGLRRLWRAARPAPAPAEKNPDFEYDR